MLDEEHYPGTYSLESLTFDQLVAGELEICTMSDIAKIEKSARLRILKLLAYFAHWLPQKSLLEVYKAVILKVEKGVYTWSTELVNKVENMLDRAVSVNRLKKESEVRKSEGQEKEKNEKMRQHKKEPGVLLKSGEKIIYCFEYNKGKCDKDTVHEGKFGGKEVTKHHVCRVCLSNDKEKKFHPENDDKCPYKSA